MKIESLVLSVTITLAILKIAGEITIPWWQIFIALWAPFALLVILGMIGGVIAIIHGYTKTKGGGKENG